MAKQGFGLTIRIGFAYGIDTIVHYAALLCGRTLTVIGSELARIYIPLPGQDAIEAVIRMQKGYMQDKRLFAIPGNADCKSFQGSPLLIKKGIAALVPALNCAQKGV